MNNEYTKTIRESNTDEELKELGWKTCTKCGVLKEPDEFYKSKRRNGLSYTCRQCHRKTIKGYRTIVDSYNWNYRRLEKMRTKARRRGLEFTLTVEDYKNLKDGDLCHYCGDPMEVVTIDRIDNNRGYILDNVVGCCFLCNKIKGNTFEENEMKLIGKGIHLFNLRMKKLVKEDEDKNKNVSIDLSIPSDK